jgi:hypothetical protein
LDTTWPVTRSKEEDFTSGRQKSATGYGVVVGRVKLVLQNLVEKHREPVVMLRAEGIKELVARALANRC